VEIKCQLDATEVFIAGTILGKNYFAFQDHCYQPDKGVAMGSPLSGTVAEIFLQHLENSHINLLKPNDIYICRTAALTSRRYILYIYSTNIQTEYFKHAA